MPDWNWLSIDKQDYKFDDEFNKVISSDGVPEDDNNNAVDTPEMFDSYINMEVEFPGGNDGEIFHATFKQRAICDNGNPLGVETS